MIKRQPQNPVFEYSFSDEGKIGIDFFFLVSYMGLLWNAYYKWNIACELKTKEGKREKKIY